MARFLIGAAFWGVALILTWMWNGATPIRWQRVFEVRRLLEEIPSGHGSKDIPHAIPTRKAWKILSKLIGNHQCCKMVSIVKEFLIIKTTLLQLQFLLKTFVNFSEADLGLLQLPRWSALWWYLAASSR